MLATQEHTNEGSHREPESCIWNRVIDCYEDLRSAELLSRRPAERRNPCSQETLRAGSRCVQGGFRERNEDKSYADAAQGVFLVADGIGGHAGGAQASACLLRSLPSTLGNRSLPNASATQELSEVQQAVERGVDRARACMAELGNDDPRLRRMGSTLAVVKVIDNHAYVASVGDCRVYRVRGGVARRLTRDQTLVQALQDAGAMTDEEARQSCYRNIITNSVAAKEMDEPVVVRRWRLRRGDRLVLATDGLTGSLSDAAIGELAMATSPQDAADELVLEALRQGSRDNVACVVVKSLGGA